MPRREVHELVVAVQAMPREGLPAILAAVAGRLAEPDVPSAPDISPATPPTITYLTAVEAAEIARVEVRTVYGWSRRVDWRLFARRLSRKVLRIEEQPFHQWLARQRGVDRGR